MRFTTEPVTVTTDEGAGAPLARILLADGRDPRELRYSALYTALQPLGLAINAHMGSHELIAAYEAAVKARAAAISRASNPDFPGTVSSAHFIAQAVKALGGKS